MYKLEATRVFLEDPGKIDTPQQRIILIRSS